MAGVQGFEPQLTDPESAVLPLNDTPLLRDLFSSAIGILHEVAPVVKCGLGYLGKFDIRLTNTLIDQYVVVLSQISYYMWGSASGKKLISKLQ
jgi:hypothetical protein